MNVQEICEKYSGIQRNAIDLAHQKINHIWCQPHIEILKDGIMVSFYNDTMFMGETLITWIELQ